MGSQTRSLRVASDRADGPGLAGGRPAASGRERDRLALRGGWTLALTGALLGAVAGCAPLQRVPVEVEPRPARVYVDGRELPSAAGEVELRADRDHKLFFKREGYASRLIILRSVPGESGPRLEPPRVEVRLEPREPGGHRVEMEREAEGPDAGAP